MKNLLIVQAHPDDAEIWSGGALHLLSERGWKINIASLTAGDLGSYRTKRQETAIIRCQEAARAAKCINAEYFCLNQPDGFVFDSAAIRLEVISLLRRSEANVVITHTPFDYHQDHRTTHDIVDAACMICSLPNVSSKEKPLKDRPVLYLGTPFNFTDFLGNAPPPPHFLVDISGKPMDKKLEMFQCHESQNEVMEQMVEQGDFSDQIRAFNAHIGAMAGVNYAEAYWQHLGAGFPTEPVIQNELTDFIPLK